jgi:hypothetical protein
MPKFFYRCPHGHEFERLVPRFDGHETVLCEIPDTMGRVKILEDDGIDIVVCGQDAKRQHEKSIPAKRAPYHGIQN